MKLFILSTKKNIKIIGTQNAQTQIRNRFKIDKNVFNIITLELKDTDKESYFSDLFDWVANHYNIPLKSATEALNNLYLHNKVIDPNNPVTPRQLLYFEKKNEADYS